MLNTQAIHRQWTCVGFHILNAKSSSDWLPELRTHLCGISCLMYCASYTILYQSSKVCNDLTTWVWWVTTEFKSSSPGIKPNNKWAILAHYIQLHIMFYVFCSYNVLTSHVTISLFVGFFQNFTPVKSKDLLCWQIRIFFLKFDLDLHILFWTEAVFKCKQAIMQGIPWWLCD